MDTLIGAHALSLGVLLVTNNTKEFRQIKGLKVLDWTA
jgi:tRNA(fMet)-specific endonuclease VapC